MHDEDLDDNHSRIPDNSIDSRDDNSESDDEPLRRPSMEAIGKQPSKDSSMSTFRKRVAASPFTPTMA